MSIDTWPMHRLEISLLGPMRVALDGEPVTGFHSGKVRALLTYLASEAARTRGRESLVGLLWPGYPERSARTGLSNALSHLRTLLKERKAAVPCLLVEREWVQLNPRGDCRAVDL